MVIRHKMYPYPVLADFLDDYVDSKFDVTVEMTNHGYDRRLYFNVTLKNEGLQQLIREGKASYAYHLECSQTGFRKAVTASEKMSDIIISHNASRNCSNGAPKGESHHGSCGDKDAHHYHSKE